MTPNFELFNEGPESKFLECRMRWDKNTLARKLEADRKLERGDVKVEISVNKDGQRYVRAYEVVRLIDCSKNLSWLADVEECLKTKRGFEILNATKAHISQLDPVVRSYADWFQWSDVTEPTPRRKFRPIT